MTRIYYTILLVLGVFGNLHGQDNKDIESKVSQLLSEMTLSEKIGQMAQITVDPILQKKTDVIDETQLRNVIVNYHVGSILNSAQYIAHEPQWWGDFILKIQEIATHETRLKIPIIYALDQVHGGTYNLGSTFFPHQIGIAATWEPSYARQMGSVISYETRACNVAWSFSPILDLGSDPRFARQYESFGEDPYLASVFGKELTIGLQGETSDIIGKENVAACMKHFIGYGVPLSGKDRTPAYIPMNALLEYHVPPYQAALDANVKSVMVNSGIVNNEPVHSSYNLLTNLLREKMKFEGVIVTDWEDVDKLFTRDRLASSSKEAVKIAIDAGIDMVMVPLKYQEFCENLYELVDQGEITVVRIDESVKRILKFKYELGLFETPNTLFENYPKYGSDEFAQSSYDAAKESITLLKNEKSVLPIDLTNKPKVLVCGPNANSRRALNGGWSFTWQGDGMEKFPKYSRTILDEVEDRFGKKQVLFIPGVSYSNSVKYDTEYKDRFEETIAAAKDVDYVILCIGENSYCEKPGDLNDLYLDDLQTELALELLNTGTEVIVVLTEGRPRIISKFATKSNTIIQTYLPSVQGPKALVDILVGDVNPSGKLPYTYPAFPNSIVPYYHKYAEEQKKSEGQYNYEGDYNPEFHFGFGLSYTNFQVLGYKIDKNKISKEQDEEITISIEVRNTGKRRGKEVVQLYSSDLYASLIPDVKRLRRFKKIELDPQETQKIEFKLKPTDLGFYNIDNEFIIESGDFNILIGTSSNDIKHIIPLTIH